MLVSFDQSPVFAYPLNGGLPADSNTYANWLQGRFYGKPMLPGELVQIAGLR
ncbi:hypothetical protein [Acinetobacter phage NJ01]|nr:hypothetical protein [Acinetobacter phage NJ01]